MNFLKKIFSPTILTISFLLLIYTFYKSEIIWDGNKGNYYKTYYLISSILIWYLSSQSTKTGFAPQATIAPALA